MVAVPEFVNEQPELPNEKGSEATSLQQDTNFDSVNRGDLDIAFNGQDDSSANALLGDLKLGDATANPVVNEALKDGSGATNPVVREALSTYKDIARVSTTTELEQALSMQRNTIVAMESKVNGQQNVMQLADDKQQADNLLKANSYFANGV